MDERGRLWLGVALATGLTCSTWMVKGALLRWKGEEVLHVTGSARRHVKADAVIWTARVLVRAEGLKDGYRRLEQAVQRASAWMDKKGELSISNVAVQPIHPMAKAGSYDESRIVAYQLTQSLTLQSPDMARVEKLRLQVAELMAAVSQDDPGIEVTADSPRYRYPALESLKLEVLAAASQSGRARAQKMAEGAGGRLGRLRQVRFGDITIASEGSTDRYSDDISSPEKDVVANVELIYDLD